MHHERQQQKKLALLQKRLSRKQKGPRNRNKGYVETGKGMSYKDASVLLPALKEEREWLNEVNSQSLQ